MNCWTVLGLSADADVRTIKRQYAALLKQTRPDEDAEGFQRLRDAYDQALSAKEWEQLNEREPDENPQQSWDLAGLSVVEVDALQLATRSLHDVSLDELRQRYTTAVEQGCAHILEDSVLQHCIEQPESADAVLQWAIDTFHWFSAWQRLELDEESVELLLSRQRERLAQPLREALAQQDEDGFVQLYAKFSQYRWLAAEQHRQWWNSLLSDVLLHSSPWPAKAFDAVCAGQGWQDGTMNPCPADRWGRLLERRDAPIFLARQRQLAEEPPATPEHRAARLLLGTGPFSQRRALARRLREEDWAQCRKLSSALYAHHPRVCAQMPGGTAFFWRDWETSFNDWPTYVGVVLACLIGAFTHYIPLGVRVTGLINIVMTSTVVFAVIGAGLNWLTHEFAHRVWWLDDRLSAALYPRSILHSPPFGVLRDLIPCALMVTGLTWFFGPIAGVVYASTQAVFGLARRFQVKPRASWEHANPLLKACLILLGAVALVIALGVFKVIASQGTVNRYQGLQPWTERLCSRIPATTAECTAPATVEQWYGKESRP